MLRWTSFCGTRLGARRALRQVFTKRRREVSQMFMTFARHGLSAHGADGALISSRNGGLNTAPANTDFTRQDGLRHVDITPARRCLAILRIRWLQGFDAPAIGPWTGLCPQRRQWQMRSARDLSGDPPNATLAFGGEVRGRRRIRGQVAVEAALPLCFMRRVDSPAAQVTWCHRRRARKRKIGQWHLCRPVRCIRTMAIDAQKARPLPVTIARKIDVPATPFCADSRSVVVSSLGAASVARSACIGATPARLADAGGATR